MYLLDTSIVIYALKGDEAVTSQVDRHRLDPMLLSVVSLMELFYGAHKSQRTRSNLAKVRRLERAFEVLSLSSETADTFGELKAHLELRGTPLDDFDLAIAATALSHNLVLVTNNEKHFKRIEGLAVENWAAFR